ncbi:MAG: amino acid permease [Bacteroidales bacterium]|nr:amino acid permease [Bacteroidales bacterium]
MANSTGEKKYIYGGISIWAMALGGIVGWGSTVLPGISFIPKAGVLGSVIGIVLCTVIAYIICANYEMMVRKFPHDRGSFHYTGEILGDDHAYLVGWAIEMAYLSLMWANASAFVMLWRGVVGDTFVWGYLYNIAGYDVYLGEIVATIVLKFTLGLITTYSLKFADILRIVLAVGLFVSTVVLFVMLISKTGFSVFGGENLFMKERPVWAQLMEIIVFGPFLFVGFETVTHLVDSTKVKTPRIFQIAGIAIFCGMVLYILLVLITASCGCDFKSTADSMQHLKNLDTFALFRSVYGILGMEGVYLTAVVAFCGLSTGVLVFHRAAARVLALMSEYKMAPAFLSKVNKHGIYVNANFVLMLTSVPVFFFGRTVIAWNADVATLATSIVYAYISICTFISVRKEPQLFPKIVSIAGIVFMVLLLGCLFVPSFISVDTLSRESYMFFTVWAVIGMGYYWYLFWKDNKRRYGKSPTAWLVMVMILFFATTMWFRFSFENVMKTEHTDSWLIDFVETGGDLKFVVIMIAVLFMFSLFMTLVKRERKSHTQFLESEEHKQHVISQNNVLQAYTERLKKKREEIEMQKAKIEKQKDEIQSSINYAYNIQHSLLTPDSVISDIFPDSFLLYKPRNVVSGDFYWMDQFGDYKVCVVGDCTGHGVPGGFMSMLGITNLNYIVGRVLDPDRILNKLRDAIINGLRQRDYEPLDAVPPTQMERSRDGLDAAVYVINEKDLMCSYAGANNPLILIRDNEIQIFKADKMPVGIFVKLEPFHCTEIQLKKGDCLYTFSDGFQDQLNCETNKKFQSRHLRELLLEIHHLPMDQQKAILEKTFEDWRGPEEKQVDDVVVFGVRV